MSERDIGFDRAKYNTLQSALIDDRRKQFGGKLYLEMGGKLFDDMHASRVLPGFTPNNKIEMLELLVDEIEIVIVISTLDLARNKVRADSGISYGDETLRLVDEFRSRGFYVGSVVISRMNDDNALAKAFKRKLERLGLKVYQHVTIKGYPNDIANIVSEKGFGRNEYIETTRDLIVVTAPGPSSGKMATCMSQLYQDNMAGISSGYAKFETFPVWDLPLDHPINIAYESATADLDDVNMIDPYHLAAYGERVVNYNRDVEVFPVLNLLFERILGESPYKSPTDMGVNIVGSSISDEQVCIAASKQEVITKEDRPVVVPALTLASRSRAPAAAFELPNGQIVTGKTSPLLGACSAMLLNALKELAGIDDNVKLLSPEAIEPIQVLKTDHLGSKNPRLHTDEVLIALAVSANTNPNAKRALAELHKLHGCDLHSSVILGSVDENIFRNLGVQVTCEPIYQLKKLYQKR